MLATIQGYLNQVKDFIFNKDNFRGVVIITVMVAILIVILITISLLNAKKKKYRKSLDILRARILNLKEKDVITNYSTYDNLKNDQKLGMLVLRWKKAIENLVREIDAQYSMLDVLEDAIESNNYQYFSSLFESFQTDINDLEQKTDKLHDEIIEYVDMASDNRKYINKYHEMSKELKERYQENKDTFMNKKDIETFLTKIELNFTECQKFIDKGLFIEADAVAATIFKDIKTLDHFFEFGPKYLTRIQTSIEPKFKHLIKLQSQFTKEELGLLKCDLNGVYQEHLETVNKIVTDINQFIVENNDPQLKLIEEFLNNSISKLEKGTEDRSFIEKNIVYQNESINKVENTAKNFVSIFKVVQGSYNITEKEIVSIEEILNKIETVKNHLMIYATQFEEQKISFSEALTYLDKTAKDLTAISRQLDANLNIIDEIYSDEKEAREKIALMTEKVNGTKKYIKYANLDQQEKYLVYIRNLNLEVSNLYMLLGAFPIDIVRLNKALEVLFGKVEKITQDLNQIIYKTLLAEYVLLYSNRFFLDEKYQKDLLIAENLFYNNSYSKAYDKVMTILNEINPNHKKFVLEKYQEKFSELFN